MMNTKTTEISRRRFMALAGGSLGFAAFAAAGLDSGMAYAVSKKSDQPRVDVEKLPIRTNDIGPVC